MSASHESLELDKKTANQLAQSSPDADLTPGPHLMGLGGAFIPRRRLAARGKAASVTSDRMRNVSFISPASTPQHLEGGGEGRRGKYEETYVAFPFHPSPPRPVPLRVLVLGNMRSRQFLYKTPQTLLFPATV